MRSILVLGGGGHARVLLDVLHRLGLPITGFVDDDPAIMNLAGVKQLGNAHPDAVPQYPPTDVELVNGFGSVGTCTLRVDQFRLWKTHGYRFVTVVHPDAIVARDVMLDQGGQIMAGAVVQPGCHIGANTIVNTRVALDHDCIVGPHVHVATGASLSGGVRVGEGAHIGTGASIIQGIQIGEHSVVGAGSVVVRDVPPHTTVYGVPAHHHTRSGTS